MIGSSWALRVNAVSAFSRCVQHDVCFENKWAEIFWSYHFGAEFERTISVDAPGVEKSIFASSWEQMFTHILILFLTYAVHKVFIYNISLTLNLWVSVMQNMQWLFLFTHKAILTAWELWYAETSIIFYITNIYINLVFPPHSLHTEKGQIEKGEEAMTKQGGLV